MKKETLISIFTLLVLWIIVANKIDNDIFLPSLFAVIERVFYEVSKPLFFFTLFETLKRTLIAYIVSLIVGISFGLLAGMYKRIYLLVNPIIILLKTIPNISYMFLLLLWINKASNAMYFIVFFIVFPMFYDTALNSVNRMDQDLKDVITLYDESFVTKIHKIYLPNCISYIKGTAIACISLSFKVCIMSEVLGFVSVGIGREMYFDKANLDMTGVFAWTFIVIFLVYVMEKVVNIIFNCLLNN